MRLPALSGHIALITLVTGLSIGTLSIAGIAYAHNRTGNNSQTMQQNKTSLFATNSSWTQDYSQQANGALSSSVWQFEQGNNDGWGNNEAQDYTANQTNVRVENGNLVIQAQKEADGSYTSARITTQGSLDFTYGKLDIVAKMPTGEGIWPAIWLWPSDDKYSSRSLTPAQQDVSWLANGEIDMFEGSAQGDNDFSGSAHSINHYPDHSERTGIVTVVNPVTTYHTYSLAWTPDNLKYMLDGKVFKTVTNNNSGFKDWPYNQNYHLILNIAMGGTMSQNLISPEMPLGINDAASPWKLQVQSIKYYPLATH